MGSHGFLAVADALAKHEGAHQTGDAGVDVHDRATREVERANAVHPRGGTAREPADGAGDFIELRLRGGLGGFVGSGGGQRLGGGGDVIGSGDGPDPVRDGEVDERHPEEHEQHHGRELHALGEGADDQRGRDHREGHLEHHVGEFRNDDAVREGRDDRVGVHALQEGLTEAADVGDHAAARVAEGDRIAVENPENAHHGDDRHDLREHRQHVLGADQTAVEQREAGNGHHQNEQRGDKHPSRVALVRHGSGGGSGGRRRRGVLGVGHASHERGGEKSETDHLGGRSQGWDGFHLKLLNNEDEGLRARRCLFHRCGCGSPAQAN